MNHNRMVITILTTVLAFGMMLVTASRAEFYRYITDDGQIHYVDDLTKVPEKYLDQIKTYQESYDHLSEEERALMLQRDRDRDRERTITDSKHFDQQAQELQREPEGTDVIIQGNQVLIPVRVSHGSQSNEALFLLDTGATHLVIFKEFANLFDLKTVKKGVSKVAGGGLVPSEMVILDSVEVGPLRVEKIGATVIENRKSGKRAFEFSGLLGIDVLQHIQYTIDFENKKIRWN